MTRQLDLKKFLRAPGDGRPQPQIPALAPYWSMLMGQLLRACSFLGVEALVSSPARRALKVSTSFGDDALGYFTERLDADSTRLAAARIVGRAKRNKAFDDCAFIGLAIDGTTSGRCRQPGCSLCRPFRNKKKEIVGYRHHCVLISVVGTGLSLPFDVEPYGAGDSEYSAGQRLLRRAVANLGVRFANYAALESGARDPIPATQARRRGDRGFLVDQLFLAPGGMPFSISHGEKPLGDREPGLQ